MAEQSSTVVVTASAQTVNGTLKALFTSRRFLVLFGYFVVGIIVALVPSLEPLKDFLSPAVIGIGFLISGYTISDAVESWVQGKNTLPPGTSDVLRELINDILDSVLQDRLNNGEPPTPVNTDTVTAPTT